MKRLLIAAALMASTAAHAALMGAAPAPTLVRGTVVSLTGPKLVLKTRAGTSQTILLAPATGVATSTVIGIDGIKANSFIGTAAEPARATRCARPRSMSFPNRCAAAARGTVPGTSARPAA